MTETIIVALLVLACAFYWLDRLVPALTRPVWRGTGAVLTVAHAPAAMTRFTTRKASVLQRAGCGACKGCDKSGSCH